MKKAGYYFIEGMPTSNGAFSGTDSPESWTPYKVWAGDLWECLGCGQQIVSGVGRHSLYEHYETWFAAAVARLGANQLQVNDC